MRKTLKNSDLYERPARRTFLALSLAASLAAFGCTTNRTHGEGEPYTGGPSVGPSSPTSNTSGTSVPTTPPPMTSSYRGNEQALATPRPQRLTADEAAAIMAGHQPRVRYLGPVDPGNGSRPYASDGLVTGQVVNSAVIPRVTINSSLNSPGGYAAITSGVGGVAASDSGAAIFAGDLATLTPTTAAIAVTPGAFAGGGNAAAATVSPNVVSTGTAVTPTTTAASSTTPATTSSTVTPTTSSSTVRVNTLNNNAGTASGSGSVRVLTANGRVVVTNVNSQSQSPK